MDISWLTRTRARRCEDCSYDRFFEAPHIGSLSSSDVMLIRLLKCHGLALFLCSKDHWTRTYSGTDLARLCTPYFGSGSKSANREGHAAPIRLALVLSWTGGSVAQCYCCLMLVPPTCGCLRPRSGLSHDHVHVPTLRLAARCALEVDVCRCTVCILHAVAHSPGSGL